MSLIKTAAQARALIGKQVWWDDHSSRYVFLRTGIVTGVAGRNIEIDDSYRWMPNLTALRDTEKGGAFPDGAPV